MNQRTHIGGVDPGLVHTGVVRLGFDRAHRTITVEHNVIIGPDAPAVHAWLGRTDETFIEGYRPRSTLATDTKMVEAVQRMKAETKGTVLLNFGVKKVVKQPLMELLGCWKFSTVTHHQDLRSAARIALFGMLKDEQLNRLVTDILCDTYLGKVWSVHR